ncbi:response regulator [Methanospirillum lacunae]|uniref:Two-component system response regulator n=1 Tax=Methanospirillum lacunae TaxID=668570 RepID=A0A2V2N5P1_9EURY|nr:response regulator [Methanospirillum lacunae]PWR71537.1 two-component system response regulator [Methanospirillum lacunae]
MATIMVIDDSPFIVDIFVTMLERGGYTVYSANSGPEGIELLKSVTPDLILLDIMMEPMDGWETLVAVKQNLATKDIPVMMLTAKQLTPQEAQEYGMYIEDYILKPVTHSELYSAIEGVIKRRQRIQDDMKKAKEGGFDELLINEYGRLVKSVEITKRLLKLLSATYDLSDPSMKLSDDINIAIRSMETNLKFQEIRVSEIREEFSGKPA